eukprot:TRINITY_DN45306_c0_g1_i1.p1 TRINITY_DN45306_c0_g1~~TRINITY_DN45306_c0_g1_i1.p1  ORF type:complete len:291 (+),score=32.93 TRINITY_DN45306_c0_g1_i1:53-874(+)
MASAIHAPYRAHGDSFRGGGGVNDDESADWYNDRRSGFGSMADLPKSLLGVFHGAFDAMLPSRFGWRNPRERPQKLLLEQELEGGIPYVSIEAQEDTDGNLKSSDPHKDNDEDMAASQELTASCCPHLSWKQRLLGCVICIGLGQSLQFLSCRSASRVVSGHPGRFAEFYSMGNISMMVGSFFLSGPERQWRKISEKGRLPTFIVFFGMMLLTLAVVLGHTFFGRALVILVMVAVQWMAQIWYILSYVPYGHTVGRQILGRLLTCCCGCRFSV